MSVLSRGQLQVCCDILLHTVIVSVEYANPIMKLLEVPLVRNVTK